MQAQSAYRSHPHDLRRVFVRSDNGEMLPVSSLVTLERTTGPDIIDRFNVYPAAKLMADPAPGYTIGAVSRQEIGTAVVGGMIAASTLALLFVPLFYKLLEDLATWQKERRQRRKERAHASVIHHGSDHGAASWLCRGPGLRAAAGRPAGRVAGA